MRRQADLPLQPGIPYGKRQKPKQTTVLSNNNAGGDDDMGISQIDFNSPPVTLTWLNLEAKAPPQDKGIKRAFTKAFFPKKEVGQSKVLLKGGHHHIHRCFSLYLCVTCF